MHLSERHIAGLFPEEIGRQLADGEIPAYRTRQVFAWLHKHAAASFREMENLPRDLIARLEKAFHSVWPLELVTRRISTDGTEKYLFALRGGGAVETVLLPEEKRQTICISTQVGCAMNCSFCATGKGGFERNLSAGEIVAQVLFVQNRLKAEGKVLSNIVYMGMGEPLANYDAVLRSVRLINHPQGLDMGARRLTISTCGLAPQIRSLAEEGLQVNLAVSLHAADDHDRSAMMPINKVYPLEELLAACDYYTTQTNRRISYEYALISGINDGPEQARRLGELLRGRLCHVNLIPINPVGPEKRPSGQRIAQFARVLERAGIPVSIRKERGTDIEAACGQLRQRSLGGQANGRV
ncbi:MAG: 23S rRNA (adenine(2503)-C(2))-methyltransferase RlmN [Limnochordia bacterium]|nr:23S rRNA (adenine(2503)-C(2))-methyltransferase RlmN [Bacillota bacterium]NLL08800.1 23S rRNA (adenine(2503)-C(2))-methyltransferase RlmN [Bacillota bacterium]HBG09906.1 23S rRNA (adenine(2503)-C(2))-methyltransferase RlmN [Bacillota bacterium]